MSENRNASVAALHSFCSLFIAFVYFYSLFVYLFMRKTQVFTFVSEAR